MFRKMRNLILFISLIFTLAACSKPKVACPGAGNAKASDFNLFDDDGKPLFKKKKKMRGKKNEYGIINKENPNSSKKKK